jgi:hypothetical protein
MSQRDKPRLALDNITAGVREREDANRTREAGHRDEVEGVVANTLNSFRGGAVGFIDWLDLLHRSGVDHFTVQQNHNVSRRFDNRHRWFVRILVDDRRDPEHPNQVTTLPPE